MSDAAGNLRSAGDHIDDARTDLEYGDLDVASDELQEQIDELDGVLGDIDSTLRKMAILDEVGEEVDDEHDH